MDGPARLRGHHLICLHFFAGEGYSEHFVACLSETMRRSRVAGVVVTEGADEVCRACPELSGAECVSEQAGGDAEIRRIDARAMELLGVTPGDVLAWDESGRRVPAILDAWFDEACDGCTWFDVCRAAGLPVPPHRR